jgi:hypothetical protein
VKLDGRTIARAEVAPRRAAIDDCPCLRNYLKKKSLGQ